MSNPTHDEADNEPRIPCHSYYLIAMCICVTAALVLLLADISGRIEFPRGLYSILTGAFVLTGAAYLIRSEGSRVIRRLAEESDELRKLARESRQRWQSHPGHVYASWPAHGNQGETVPLSPPKDTLEEAEARGYVKAMERMSGNGKVTRLQRPQ